MRIGLLVNPRAGLGGPAALKGSDAPDVEQRAARAGVRAQAGHRAAITLRHLRDGVARGAFELVVWGGAMGEDSAREAGVPCRVVGRPRTRATTAEDTRTAVSSLRGAGCELLLFAGGDGTARDVHASLDGSTLPVLGIPAGVKMHSGVFAVTPADAGRLLVALVAGDLVSVEDAEVRDLDEASLARGEVRVAFHGTLRVPVSHRYVQHVKSGGREDERLAVIEIAAGIRDGADPEDVLLLGPGSTVREVKRAFGFEGTLIGFDAVRGDGELLGLDLDESAVHALLEAAAAPASTDNAARRVRAVITFMAGQGVLLGRGNQQLSPRNLRRLGGHSGLEVIASHARLLGLGGRPLRLDTGDAALDAELAGLVEIRCGYDTRVLHALRDHGG